MSENLIGLDEAHTDDPLRQVLVLQKQMQLLQEECQNLMRRRAKLNSEPSEANDSKDSLHVAVQGSLEQCRQHFLSIREVAKENMKKWSTELDKVALRFSRSPGPRVSSSPGLQVSRSPGLRVSRSPGLQVSRSPGLQVFRSPDLQLSSSPALQVSKSPGAPGL